MSIRVGTLVRPYYAIDGTFQCNDDALDATDICVGIAYMVIENVIKVRWVQSCKMHKPPKSGLTYELVDNMWEVGQIH